jgi:GNAT superfamily N-acetyltransferase
MDALLVADIQLFIQAFIQSFESAYDSSHRHVEGTDIFYYGPEFSASPHEVVPYQSILFGLDKTPEELHALARSVQFAGDGSYAIQVFHRDSDLGMLKLRFQALGCQYFLPNLLQSIELPAAGEAPALAIDLVSDARQVDFINATFSDFKPFPAKLAGAQDCSAFYAQIDHQAAGWGYLVFPNAETAYVGGMFTAPAFRQRGVASAILNRMHHFAFEKGVGKILLVPSFMAWNFYSRRGYRTIAHFSTFLPSEESMSANK